MLKGIHPLIGPDLLATLGRMGHGDLLLVVDRNYPAYAARVPVHRMDGVGVPPAMEALLTLLPVDDLIDARCSAWALRDRALRSVHFPDHAAGPTKTHVLGVARRLQAPGSCRLA
jgi:L-fucose mutarotase/ribose pyranase (RbsD/FucU family)